MLHAVAIAFHPGDVDVGTHPGGRDAGQAIARMAQRFAHIFQAVQGAHRREHVRGVGALLAAGLEQAGRAAALQHRIEQQGRGIILEQTAAKRAQDRGGDPLGEAGIVQREAEQLLPGDAVTDGLGRLRITEPVHELKDGDDGEAGGGEGRLTSRGIEMGEVLVVEEHAKVLTELEGPRPVGMGSVGSAIRVSGDRIVAKERVTHGHRSPSSCAATITLPGHLA